MRLILPGTKYGIDGKPRDLPVRPVRIDPSDYSVLEWHEEQSIDDIVDALEKAPEAPGAGDLWDTPLPGVEASQPRRAALAADVEAYLAAGGTITQCEPGERSGVFDGWD